MLRLLNPRFGKPQLPNRRLTRARRLNNRDRRRVGESMSPQKVSLLQRRARRASGPKYSRRYSSAAKCSSRARADGVCSCAFLPSLGSTGINPLLRYYGGSVTLWYD
jgi:hypothetical protein